MIPFSQTIVEVVEKVSPSVVTCWPVGFERDGSHAVATPGVGSGFIIDSRGYILTNHHVIHGTQKLSVEFADRRKIPANVVGYNASLDVALIKVDAEGLSVAKIGDSDKLKIGQLVIALGKPSGFRIVAPTVSAGIVSSLGQRFVGETTGLGSGSGVNETPEGWIQTDAAINQGNSGGPLVDERGLVIGINTRSFTPLGTTAGLNFAVPINVAKRVIERYIKLEAGEATSGIEVPREAATQYTIRNAGKPWSGISGLDIPKEVATNYNLSKGGILVTRVTPNGPADKAGVISGDVIFEIDGVSVETMDKFHEEIKKRRVGERVELTVRRRQQTIRVPIALEAEA